MPLDPSAFYGIRRSIRSPFDQWPTCWVCKHQVDELERRQTFDDAIILVARCHGATQEVRIGTETIRRATDVSVDYAFRPEELPTETNRRYLTEVADET